MTGAFKDAKTPFNAAEADIIIRTSDGVDFHLHKLVLSLASPFFRDMFSLPSPSYPSPAEGEMRNGKQVVRVTEMATELDLCLRAIYPGILSRPQTIADVASILHICQKYDFAVPTAAVELVLQSSMDIDPLRVFALCVRYGLRHLASRAAARTLPLPLTRLDTPELRQIPAEKYMKLVKFHHERSQAISEVVLSTSWFDSGLSGISATPPQCRACWSTRDRWYIRQNLIEYLVFAYTALRSCQGVDAFPLCRPVLPGSPTSCEMCGYSYGEMEYKRFSARLRQEIEKEWTKVQPPEF